MIALAVRVCIIGCKVHMKNTECEVMCCLLNSGHYLAGSEDLLVHEYIPHG